MIREPTSINVWARGVFQLASGRQMTRTVRKQVTLDPEDVTRERIAIALAELVDELRGVGHEFPEGHGVLVELLGTAHG